MIVKITLKDGETCAYIAGSILTYENYITIFDKHGISLRTIPTYAIESLYYNANNYGDKDMYVVEIYTLEGEHIIEEECYINLFNDSINIYDLFGDLIYVIHVSQIEVIICNRVEKLNCKIYLTLL